MTHRLDDTAMLARLIAFDTVSRNSNLALADFVSDYLDRPGVRVHRNPSADGDKTNLCIEIGPEVDPAARRGLVLSGHMDVVPADEEEWVSDPFSLTPGDTTLAGRGTADMKGFLALATNAAASLDPSALRHPLVLLFTYDEELGTLGAKRFVDTWPPDRPLPRHVIIGEPTSLEVIRLHKGHCTIRIAVGGVPAHSGYPHLGTNAIEPVGRAIVALSALRAELERERLPHHQHFPEVPYVALNMAQIHGGVAVNVVPDWCELQVGFRLLPGMESGPLIDRVRTVLRDALRGTDHEIVVNSESPPLLLDENAEIYRTLCKDLDQHHTSSASYATDAGWFQQLDLDCVVCGPGSIEVAHKPNESIPREDLTRAASLLDRMIRHSCLAAT